MRASTTQIGRVSKRSLYKLLLVLVSLCLWASPAMAVESPRAVVQNGADQVLSILRQHPQPSPARVQQIEAVISRYFDFETMARMAVGRRWKSVSPVQQKEFIREYKKLLFATYLGDIERYSNEQIRFFTRSLSPEYALVEGSVYNGGNPIYLDYSLHLKDGNWEVYDVAVSGISLAVNYRDQFNAFLATRSFNDLLAALRQKTDRMCRFGRC
ncbi:MAG: MlaC/ttg2D family ABC transporter substrate-binding protein [Syntrophobacteraceae bacterium]